MDLSLTEDQDMLKKMAREFLEKECPKKLVRQMEEDEEGYSPELWSKIADLGWMGLVFQHEYGGMAGNFLDLAVLLEEMGRALLPSPFTSTVVGCGLPISFMGTEEQKKAFLPGIINGKSIFSLALTEPQVGYGSQDINTRATPDGDNYIINGTKLFTHDAHISDYILCAAKTNAGISLFIIDAKTPGITCNRLKSFGSDRQCEVVFKDVEVLKENILGKLGKGWEIVEKIMTWGALAQCALMLGGAQYVLEMTVQYAKERIQFDKPIGSFQAIQHKLANMAIDVDGSRFITYKAAWMLSQKQPSEKIVSMAKAWVSDAYNRVCAEAHQIHGGIGFTKDHDLQLYSLRAKASELAFGDADYHRELVASTGL